MQICQDFNHANFNKIFPLFFVIFTKTVNIHKNEQKKISQYYQNIKIDDDKLTNMYYNIYHSIITGGQNKNV